MAFSEKEKQRCEEAMSAFMEKRRPPEHMRSKIDLGYRIEGQSIEIFEIRPYWRDPSRIIEGPVAKTTYVRSQNVWKVYWQRADLKWHLYEPVPEVKDIEAFLKVVEADEYACFFG